MSSVLYIFLSGDKKLPQVEVNGCDFVTLTNTKSTVFTLTKISSEVKRNT